MSSDKKERAPLTIIPPQQACSKYLEEIAQLISSTNSSYAADILAIAVQTLLSLHSEAKSSLPPSTSRTVEVLTTVLSQTLAKTTPQISPWSIVAEVAAAGLAGQDVAPAKPSSVEARPAEDVEDVPVASPRATARHKVKALTGALGNFFQYPEKVTVQEIASVFTILRKPAPPPEALQKMVDYCLAEKEISPIPQLNIPVPGSETPGFSAIYRSPLPSKGDRGTLSIFPPTVNTMSHLFIHLFKEFSERKCLGTPIVPLPADGTDPYSWKTYAEVWDDVMALGVGLTDLFPDFKPQEFVGVHLRTSPQWSTLQLCAAVFNFVPCTMYDSLGQNGIHYVLTHCDCRVLFTSTAALKSLCESILPRTPSLKQIVCVGSAEDISQFQEKLPAGVSLTSYEAVLEAGKKLNSTTSPTTHRLYNTAKPEDGYLICFTSGTTGTPKGAFTCHHAVLHAASVMPDLFPPSVNPHQRHLAFLPMAHVMEQLIEISFWTWAGSITYLRGSVMDLATDLQLAKPTRVITAPRVLNKFYSKIKGSIAQMHHSDPLKAALFDLALATKRNVLIRCGRHRSPWDFIAFQNIRDTFGGAIEGIGSSSAPLAAEVQEFFRLTLGATVAEGYGMTEVLISHVSPAYNANPLIGPSGFMTLPNCEIRLRDLPELNYTHKDEAGPAGELCIKGPCVLVDYYKDPENTAAALDADRWLSTGDVARLNPTTGGLFIIDRKKALFKLSQGEYVAPEKVEAVIIRTPGILQAFVTGESDWDFPIAVVVLDPEKPVAKDQNPLVLATELTKAVEETCRGAGLSGFEIPRGLVIAPESFDAMGLITPTMKLIRNQAKIVFKDELQRAYLLALGHQVPRGPPV